MKILKAKINWMLKWNNNPDIEILVDRVPKLEELRFEERDGLYYSELDGYVRFFFYKSPGDGYGGTGFHITMKDDTKLTLKGPWSSRAGCANRLKFGPCADVRITDDPNVFQRGYTFFGSSITLDKLVEAAQMANVYLVKQYIDNRGRFGGTETGNFSPKYFVVPFSTQISQVEWIAVPSLDSCIVQKPKKCEQQE